MANYLKMPQKQQILALLALGWSYRRIEAETGVRRETVGRYDRQRQAKAAKTFPGSEAVPPAPLDAVGPADGANAAKPFPGSHPNAAETFAGSARPARFAAAQFRDAITEKLDAGLTLQRVWQDLVEEFGYGASYESVKRYARTIAPRRRAVGVFHSAPGAEGQIDFFRGAPTLDGASGQWRRPWVFRMTLGHSRHGYEEAVWDQRLETFLRLHERAFRDLGGVPCVIRHDFVPGNKIVFLCPSAFCGGHGRTGGRCALHVKRWPHNERAASADDFRAHKAQGGCPPCWNAFSIARRPSTGFEVRG